MQVLNLLPGQNAKVIVLASTHSELNKQEEKSKNHKQSLHDASARFVPPTALRTDCMPFHNKEIWDLFHLMIVKY